MGFMSEWGRELASCVPHLSPRIPGIWGGVTCDPDVDRRAFLRSMARVGGHAAVDALILMPYLREEQHRAGGKGQGCAIFYPVDLRGRLGRDGTGQGHGPTRSDCSTFRLNQQLNALWRQGLPDSGLDGGCVQGSAPRKAQTEAAGIGRSGPSLGWGHCEL